MFFEKPLYTSQTDGEKERPEKERRNLASSVGEKDEAGGAREVKRPRREEGSSSLVSDRLEADKRLGGAGAPGGARGGGGRQVPTPTSISVCLGQAIWWARAFS